MSEVHSIEDTIAAVSTPAGVGGIGIVRMSGPQALTIADKIFIPKGEGKPSIFSTHTVHYGDVVHEVNGQKKVVDEVLLTVMRAPKSYTCEDVVEVSCHGGSVAVNAILSIMLEAGARLAEPGEFTKRAFLNGRIDLAQAEAVLDIIRAKTSKGLEVSEHQLKGDLTRCLEEIRERLLDVYVQMEAFLNFPDDAADEQTQKKLRDGLSQSLEEVTALLSTAEQGRVLREGIKIVICGKPNVGKSSLLNIFLRQPRAIVSHIEGTTRDTIEETAQINGVPFQVVDTAGILEPRDVIEEEAVRRSHIHIEQADLVLLLLDASAPLTREDLSLAQKVSLKRTIVVVNKIDLPFALTEKDIQEVVVDKKMVEISAFQQKGIEQLQEIILKEALHGAPLDPQHILLTNVRHIDSLTKCEHEIVSALKDIDGFSLEFISERIKQAVNYLDRITGRDVDGDLLDQIFSEFCIGK